MYLLIDEDGTITEAEELPRSVDYDCWPRAIKIELYAGPDFSVFELKKDGWKEI